MSDKKIARLILKDDDILVIRVKFNFSRKTIRSLYTQIKKQLHPKKNKILILPDEVELSVISDKEIKEHVTELDLWQLWDEEKVVDKIEDL